MCLCICTCVFCTYCVYICSFRILQMFPDGMIRNKYLILSCTCSLSSPKGLTYTYMTCVTCVSALALPWHKVIQPYCSNSLTHSTCERYGVMSLRVSYSLVHINDRNVGRLIWAHTHAHTYTRVCMHKSILGCCSLQIYILICQQHTYVWWKTPSLYSY